MRLLIDGYNLMYAAGRVARSFGPNGFRRAREGFLDDLARRLGEAQVEGTTVVFDSTLKYRGPQNTIKHRGLEVVYSAGEDSADALILEMVSAHPAPKTLTVVTSDSLVRQATMRRGCRVLRSEEFMEGLEEPKSAARPTPRAPDDRRTRIAPKRDESEYWMKEFASVDAMSELIEAFPRNEYAPTDEEVARIRREVQNEGSRPPRAKRPKPS